MTNKNNMNYKVLSYCGLFFLAILGLAKRAAMNMTGTGLKFNGADRTVQRVKLYRFE